MTCLLMSTAPADIRLDALVPWLAVAVPALALILLVVPPLVRGRGDDPGRWGA